MRLPGIVQHVQRAVLLIQPDLLANVNIFVFLKYNHRLVTTVVLLFHWKWKVVF